MAKTPTPEEAIERAQRAQESRIESVRVLAVARQDVSDAREEADRQRAELEARLAQQISEAERADVAAYNAATGAGWSADELRKIGFSEPEKKARTRRRAARRNSTSGTAASNVVTTTHEGASEGGYAAQQ